MYKRQWGHCVLPRHTSSILGLSYAIQVSMEDDAMGEEKEREQKDVFRRAGHAWGGGGGMEREAACWFDRSLVPGNVNAMRGL